MKSYPVHVWLNRAAWCALVGFPLALGMLLVPRPGQALAASASMGKTIDWMHPVWVEQVPGRVHSGLASALPPGVVPEPASSSVGQVQSNANFPTTCWNNSAYYMGDQGQFTWTRTHWPVEAWVAYMWCPRWQGDRIGINWAYGRDYVFSGCQTMLIGDHLSSPWMGWYGASIFGPLANDGETNAAYTVCNGSYAWDDSLTVLGNGIYSMLMLLTDTSGDQFFAISPTF